MADKWTDSLLDQMREVADPLADEVVASIVESGGLKTFDEAMRMLVNNRDEIPASLPRPVHDYFENTAALPAWADPAKIAQGESVFDVRGPEMITMLFFVALPYAYATKKGSNVLAISAELTRHVHRRIFRTAQFIMDVMQPGGLGPDGRGIRSAQKVRLLHASIRYYIAYKPKWKSEWDPAWGAPINQEDLAGTLMDFSAGVMRGLDRMGIGLSADDADAYLHCWKVVGHIMGIRPELLPENVPDAFDLANSIIERQMGKSDSGRLLIKDLLAFVRGFMPRPLSGFPATAVRYLSGDRVADIIESGPSDWTLLLLKLQGAMFRNFEGFIHRFPGMQRYIRFMSWHLIDRAVLYEEGSGRNYFEIPDHLRRKWRLSKPTGSAS